jgi:hypothetical protein
MDADGSAAPVGDATICRRASPGADFVKGSRFAQRRAGSDITLTRKWGNRGLNALVNALYGTSYPDLCYGYNALGTLPALHAGGL